MAVLFNKFKFRNLNGVAVPSVPGSADWNEGSRFASPPRIRR